MPHLPLISPLRRDNPRLACRVRSFDEELKELDRTSRRRSLRLCKGPQGPALTVDGRPVINVSSNDYLGLAAHPLVCEALIRGVETHGAGAGASRLVCGTHTAHAELEQSLADFKGTEAALTFGSGYAGALGVLGAILRPGDVALLDRLAHASLIDGAQSSGARVRTFRHNQTSHLAERLEWAATTAAPGGRILVVTEGIFSMDGDRAPLAEMAAVCRQHGALFFLDEAHSFGICGHQGRGLAEESGTTQLVDLHFGTLSKAVGLAGGYVAGSRAAIDLVLNRARPFIYSTAPPPALAAAAAFVIREIFPGPLGAELRDRLWDHATQFARLLGPHGPGHPPPSPIFPIVLGSESAALHAAETLRTAGYFAPAIRPPTVPQGRSRLRITLSAAHSAAHGESLAATLRSLLAAAPEPAAPPPVNATA